MMIAVVDDMTHEREHLSEQIRQSTQRMGLQAEITAYESGTVLLRTFRPKQFDVIILDIYMQELDGMETARRIRALDERVSIVFITVTDAFALEGYEVQACDYLVKPVGEGKLERALRRCIERQRPSERYIDVKVGHQYYRVLTNNVLYAIKRGNSIWIHMAGGLLKTYNTFTRFAPLLLRDDRFLQCYHGCVINMQHVRRLTPQGFEMKDGTVIPVRRKSSAEIKARWIGFEAGLLEGGAG